MNVLSLPTNVMKTQPAITSLVHIHVDVKGGFRKIEIFVKVYKCQHKPTSRGLHVLQGPKDNLFF